MTRGSPLNHTSAAPGPGQGDLIRVTTTTITTAAARTRGLTSLPARPPGGTGRGPGSHLCPVPGCRQAVSADRLMCRPHWYTVPRPARDSVWATWRSGAGAGTPAHTAAIIAAVAAATPAGGTR